MRLSGSSRLATARESDSSIDNALQRQGDSYVAAVVDGDVPGVKERMKVFAQQQADHSAVVAEPR